MYGQRHWVSQRRRADLLLLLLMLVQRFLHVADAEPAGAPPAAAGDAAALQEMDGSLPGGVVCEGRLAFGGCGEMLAEDFSLKETFNSYFVSQM